MTRLGRCLLLCLIASVLSALPLTGSAHKPSDSYLNIRLADGHVDVRWDIALRDLEYAIGLDADGDGAITWGELRAGHRAIADYALARLTLSGDAGSCAPTMVQHQVDKHSDGAYAVMSFSFDCPVRAGPWWLDYQLFFDLDPSHRGLLQIDHGGRVETAVLSPEQSKLELAAGGRVWWRQFVDYWREGVFHIWIGLDHILFLLALLLPAVVMRDGGRWREVGRFRTAVWDVVGVVTAFTIAHSVTLSFAVLGWVSVPTRLVESVIAATVLLAALNNLYPLFYRRRRLMAFALGLVHGLGFAGVLADLGLPSDALVLALGAFNVGVESGQLVIVLAFLPLAFALRRGWFYRRVVLNLGSCAVAALAALWLIERSLGLRFMPI